MAFPVTTATQVLSVDKNLIQNRIREVMGIGEEGYGISALQSRLHSTGTLVRASHFQALYDDLDRIYQHQTGNNLNAANTFSSATVITTASVNYLNTFSQYVIDPNNRYFVHPSQSTASVELIDPRVSIWSTEISSSILCTWTSVLQANYFFNSGGQLQLQTNHQNNWSTAREKEWARLLTAIGTSSFTHSNWIAGIDTVSTYTADAPYNFYVTVNTDVAEKSVQFTVELVNDTASLIVYPDELEFTVQDGTITANTLSASTEVLQDVVFTLTNVSTELKPSASLIGFDIVQT